MSSSFSLSHHTCCVCIQQEKVKSWNKLKVCKSRNKIIIKYRNRGKILPAFFLEKICERFWLMYIYIYIYYQYK